MDARELLLLVVLAVAVGAAVVLYVLAPSGRLAWLLAITFGSTIAGLLLARSGRPRRPRAP